MALLLSDPRSVTQNRRHDEQERKRRQQRKNEKAMPINLIQLYHISSTLTEKSSLLQRWCILMSRKIETLATRANKNFTPTNFVVMYRRSIGIFHIIRIQHLFVVFNRVAIFVGILIDVVVFFRGHDDDCSDGILESKECTLQENTNEQGDKFRRVGAQRVVFDTASITAVFSFFRKGLNSRLLPTSKRPR